MAPQWNGKKEGHDVCPDLGPSPSTMQARVRALCPHHLSRVCKSQASSREKTTGCQENSGRPYFLLGTGRKWKGHGQKALRWQVGSLAGCSCSEQSQQLRAGRVQPAGSPVQSEPKHLSPEVP